MHVSNDPIPKNRMRQFHEILCATGGRYTNNPRDCGDVMRVDYVPGDYRAQSVAWRKRCRDGKLKAMMLLSEREFGGYCEPGGSAAFAVQAKTG